MRARAIFLSALMILSIVAGSVAFAGGAAGAPAGFVTIDDSQVTSDLPENTPMGEAAHEIADAGVMTSNHSQTLEVLVTNPGRAKQYSESGTVFGSGPIAIVLSDDVASEGRTVALPAEEIEDVLDYKPELARGTHEDGSPWNSTIEYKDGWMLVEVPHFSDNVVTFAGSVQIGDTFSEGSTVQYDISDLDAASDPVVNLTGIQNTEDETRSFPSVTNGDFETISVAGNDAPVNSNVTLTGKVETNHVTSSYNWGPGGGSSSISVGGNQDTQVDMTLNPSRATWTTTNTNENVADLSNGPDNIAKLTVDWHQDTDDISRDIELLGDNNVLWSATDAISGSGEKTWTVNEDVSGYSTVEVEIKSTYYHIDDATIHHDWPQGVDANIGSSTNSLGTVSSQTTVTETVSPDSSIDVSALASNDGRIDTDLEWTEETATEDPSIDIGSSTVTYSGTMADGETYTEAVALSIGDNSMNATLSGETAVDVNYTEITRTEDLGVALNDEEWANHTDTLADGETTSLTLSKSTLKEGTNNVTVDMPSLSADAPAMQVGFDYSHDAQDDVNVSYEGEKFSERYNVSKTFAGDQQNPDLTIPFAGEAISIRDAEYRLNGGSWQSAGWIVQNTTGTVELPDMTAGDTVDVRTNATKVTVQDGAIQVLEATPAADKLDSKIEITEHGADFALHVSGIDDDRLFYASNPSWSEPDAHAYVDASANQKLRFPEAGVGSTTNVQDLPLWVTTENDVEVAIKDATAMEFQVRPGATEDDQIEVEYRDTESGQAYELADLTNDGRQVDTDTAESPVFFSTLDNARTYIIQETTLESAEPPQMAPLEESSEFPFILIGAIVAGLGGLLLIVRGLGGFSFSGRTRSRSSGRSWSVPVLDYSLSMPSIPSIPIPSWSPSRSSTSSRSSTQQLVLIGGMVIIGLVAIELSTPGSLFQMVLAAGTIAGDTLEELFTIFVGVGALLAMWWLDQRTSESIPTWLMAVAAIVVVVYILETLDPGVLLGPASSGFETISPLFWLVLVGGGAYLIWGYIKSRNSPDTRVTLQLRGRNK